MVDYAVDIYQQLNATDEARGPLAGPCWGLGGGWGGERLSSAA